MDKPPKCSKCGGVMTEGYIVDRASHIITWQAVWAPGKADWGLMGAQVKPQQLIPVCTFRCENCGFLESYANRG